MKNTIVNAYQWILYTGMALWIIGWTYGGYNSMGIFGDDAKAAGFIFGLLFGVFSSVFFLGFIFIIIQIRDLLQDLVNIHKGTEKFYLAKSDKNVWGDSALIKCSHCNEHNNIDKYSVNDLLRCKNCKNIIQKPSE